jgi:hypothetical protein
MSKDKEIIDRLFKIVAKQQMAITKLAEATKPGIDLKSALRADIIDAIYGPGKKLIPGVAYPTVQYANVQSTPQGSTLIVGINIPPTDQHKWQSMREGITPALKTKYSSMLGQPISAIEWRGTF